ncbi:hypothetical protein N7492_005982, partial [Penicillium capsulatum]
MFILRLLTVGVLAAQPWAMPTTADRGLSTSTGPSPTAASSSTVEAAAQLEQLSKIALAAATKDLAEKQGHAKPGECTVQTLRIRRNWHDFSRRERKNWINAQLCLQTRQPRTPSQKAPGVRTRYDDFVATHINQTMYIHYSGTFLAWHRWFIFELEEAMREECGYRGDYPYWDWGADVDGMEKSPVFDGSDTSLSGDGEYVEQDGDIPLVLPGVEPVKLPTGEGGGCVSGGPFKDYTQNLGPASLIMPGGNVTALADPLTYNPRCLKRDLTTEILQMFNTYPRIVGTILNHSTIWDFEMGVQGVPGTGSIGVHGGGHYSMGGDPGRDVYVSPADPAFWLHHGMIDRIYWIWQSLDLPKRRNAISGTGTFLNHPASANTTLDTVLNLGYAREHTQRMKDVLSTTAGPFCYVY